MTTKRTKPKKQYDYVDKICKGLKWAYSDERVTRRVLRKLVHDALTDEEVGCDADLATATAKRLVP